MAITIEDGDLEEVKENLIRYAIQGNWNEVVDIYKQQPKVHKAEIILSGETALHIAVSEGKEDAVEELVKSIRHPVVEALEVKNERGNTPLHLAASMGNVRMCMCIAGKDPKLVGARNNENETPLFLAALHGKKDAFLCLHEICDENKRFENGRRGDGKTILHVAIFREFFDLAFQIIHLYEYFVNFYDAEGFTPLHLLASRPTAFRSGTHLSWISNIIYQCFIIEKLEKILIHQHVQGTFEGQKKPWYPENYETCINFWNILKTVLVPGRKCGCCPADTENPEESQLDGQQSRKGAQLLQLFPPNYDICFELIKLACKAILVILGLGFENIQEIKDKKERHTISRQIMNELLKRASRFKYSGTGRRPTRQPKDEEGRFNDREKKTTPVESVLPSDADRNGDESICQEKKTEKVEVYKGETPILIAAKNGITEMVEEILNHFPVAILDMNFDHKNIVLLAVENRQLYVYELLRKRIVQKETVFRIVDNVGNSALHLAAMQTNHDGLQYPNSLLEMMSEAKWFEFVKHSMSLGFFPLHNNHNKTAEELFTETHRHLVRKVETWLIDISNCSVTVAGIIMTAALATSAALPGGIKESNGKPNLEHHPAFSLFAVSSLVALYFSVLSLVLFLSILASRYKANDFVKVLPRNLLRALTSLFLSIAAGMVTFCAGHFFILGTQLKYAAIPGYVVACVSITALAVIKFGFYFDLLMGYLKILPCPPR